VAALDATHSARSFTTVFPSTGADKNENRLLTVMERGELGAVPVFGPCIQGHHLENQQPPQKTTTTLN